MRMSYERLLEGSYTLLEEVRGRFSRRKGMEAVRGGVEEERRRGKERERERDLTKHILQDNTCVIYQRMGLEHIYYYAPMGY